jgi:hypothetical protein
MSMLSEVSAYLASNSVGVVGTSIFLDYLPDAPDTVVALFAYPGAGPTSMMGGASGAAVVRNPRLQVLTRGTPDGAGTVAARAAIDSIYALLEQVVNTTLSSVRYLSIEAVDEPALLERDDTQRPVYVCNFEVMKYPS